MRLDQECTQHTSRSYDILSLVILTNSDKLRRYPSTLVISMRLGQEVTQQTSSSGDIWYSSASATASASAPASPSFSLNLQPSSLPAFQASRLEGWKAGIHTLSSIHYVTNTNANSNSSNTNRLVLVFFLVLLDISMYLLYYIHIYSN